MARKEDSGNQKGDEQEQTLSRREFLHLAGLAAGGGALFAATSELLSAGVVEGEGSASPLIHAAVPQAPLPSHRALLVEGIHAYADRLSVKPGETINFHVSSDAQYAMQIYRLGIDPDTPDSDQPMSNVIEVATPAQQPIHPGSYVSVANGLAATDSLTALTLECWVRPFVGLPTYDDFNYTGLITQLDFPDGAGYGLFVRFTLDDFRAHTGSVAFHLGDGGAFNQEDLL